MCDPRRASAGQGFSLLEAVVALAIVGLAAVASLAALGQELRSAERVRRALESNALAEERLARLRLLPREELSPLADSLRQGRFGPPFADYTWHLASRSMPARDELLDVELVIRWADGAYPVVTRLYRPRSELPRLSSGRAR
jgi:prepilin-type N-terminal cleavage/methylation domain-containing protein